MIKKFVISSGLIKHIIMHACNLLGAVGITYSQNCEDRIIQSILEKNDGIYVDVGAHHPIRFSNTFQLFLNGWSGINIDPLPGCMDLFDLYRPKDVNLNVGISSNAGSIKYFSFKDPAYNTINDERAAYLTTNNITQLIDTTNIEVLRLKEVFDKYIVNKTIDLLTIDVETMELSVLKSNDWNLYRPRMIVMESIVSCYDGIDELKNDSAVDFLLKNNYIVVAKVNNAVFFRDSFEMNENKK